MNKIWNAFGQIPVYKYVLCAVILSFLTIFYDKGKERLPQKIKSKALNKFCVLVLTIIVEFIALLVPEIITPGDSTGEPSGTPTDAPISSSLSPEASGPLTLSICYDDLSNYEKLNFSGAKATSELIYSGELFRAVYAIDGDLDSTWQEGAEGLGIGESLTLYFPSEEAVNIIEIYPGFISSDYVFENNGRPKSLKFEFSDGSSCTFDFEDKRGGVVLKLSETVITDSICITILDAYDAPWEDTAIAEVVAYQ